MAKRFRETKKGFKGFKKYQKGYRRAKAMYRPSAAIIPVGFPPQSTTVKLRYIEENNLNVTTIPEYYTYSANGLFDPNITGVGHQPMGYDQLTSMYNRYIVMGGKIEIDFWSQSLDQLYGVYVGVKLDDDTSFIQDCATLQESSNVRYKWMSMQGDNSQSRKKVVMYFSPKKMAKVKNIFDNRGNLGAAVGANPTEQYYWHIWAGTTNDNTDLNAIYYRARITYIVQFDERKDVASS